MHTLCSDIPPARPVDEALAPTVSPPGFARRRERRADPARLLASADWQYDVLRQGGPEMALSQQTLDQLNDALAHRDVKRGFSLLQSMATEMEGLDPADPLAISFLISLGQWISLGYRDSNYFDRLIARFARVDRRTLTFYDYVKLRFAEAQAAFLAGDMTATTEIFGFLLRIEPGILDGYLVQVAHYWNGRAHRKKGDFDAAQHHILTAKRLACDMGLPCLVALAKFQEARLLFREGRRKEVFRLLDEVEETLASTGDALTLGNIEAARGRFVRRLGQYTRALEHFDRAIEIYGKHFPDRANMARALVNSAYVKRLIALDLKHRQKAGRARAADHVRYLEICNEALDLLARAQQIYSHLRHQAGTGSVLVNAGYLHLDSGDIDQAEDDASRAFALGEQEQDSVLLARARILLATIQNERAEEQLGDYGDLAAFAHSARTHAEEAIQLAKRNENTRILAGAYVVRGFIAASDFFQDWDAAKQYTALAGELVGKDDLDHLSKQLTLLKTRILRSTGIDEMLRAWSEGVTGGKTFQQTTEEFAELVIPKVWMREERKVTRVADLLSISPKKVRRILRNVGYLEHD